MRAIKSLTKSKPSHQLFLFSNKFETNISNYFSGNIIIESSIREYDFATDKPALQATKFMELFCESRAIKKFENITIVLNYKPTGLTFAEMCGIYGYMVAVHNTCGYKLLDGLHDTYLCLERRLEAFDAYASLTSQFVFSRKQIQTNTESDNSITENELIRIRQRILSEKSSIFSQFEKEFIPHY